jgi:predicted 2-oxoglutarate/Fe(II)-dependent dioxygenase YbiX
MNEIRKVAGLTSSSDCKLMRELAKEAYDNGFMDSGHPNGNGRATLDLVRNKKVRKAIFRYTDQIIKMINWDKPLYVRDYLFNYYPKGGCIPVHTDDDQMPECLWSSVAYLNGPNDYEGGEIYFPNLGGLELKPEEGETLIFPCSYEHGVRELQSGVKYTLAVSFTEDPSKELFYERMDDRKDRKTL